MTLFSLQVEGFVKASSSLKLLYSAEDTQQAYIHMPSNQILRVMFPRQHSCC